jgi:TetR/AcrR family transcriptional repressor of nem operon
MARKFDKRGWLIDKAKKLIYNQGFNITTLVDIANETDVPLGSVYYYFKTKADVGIAVLNSIAEEQKIFFEHLNQEPSPKTRLHYFLEHAKQDSKLIMLQGCHIGTLCQEFAREGGVLHKLAAKLMMDALFWMEAQFYTVGFIEEASDLSLDLMYKLQGVFLLAYAFKDSNLITRQITLLQEFIKEQLAERVHEFEESTKARISGHVCIK